MDRESTSVEMRWGSETSLCYVSALQHRGKITNGVPHFQAFSLYFFLSMPKHKVSFVKVNMEEQGGLQKSWPQLSFAWQKQTSAWRKSFTAHTLPDVGEDREWLEKGWKGLTQLLATFTLRRAGLDDRKVSSLVVLRVSLDFVTLVVGEEM